MKYTGSCHCQKVRFEVDMQIEGALTCNCSICSKRGALLAFVADDKFHLVSGKESLTDYQWGKKKLHHTFCSHCGILSFCSGTGPDGGKMRAINLRCLDGVDFEKLPLQHFDGKSL